MTRQVLLDRFLWRVSTMRIPGAHLTRALARDWLTTTVTKGVEGLFTADLGDYEIFTRIEGLEHR